MDSEVPPPISADDERARLASLASFRLDQRSELDLDEIVSVVAQLCETPMATISFVTEDSQWFKAKIGVPLEKVPRAMTFCAHTIAIRAPLVVADALLDPRFANNPFVNGPPHIRFYAGFPLITTSGSAVGTLTVMDHVTRSLDPVQVATLQLLAGQVVGWLELRHSLMERDQAGLQLLETQAALRQEMARTQSALVQATSEQSRNERLHQALWETTTDAVVVLDASDVIRFASPSCFSLLGYRPQELVGQGLSVLQPEPLRKRHVEGMQRYLRTRVRRLDWRATETLALRKGGAEVPVEIAFSELELDGEVHFVGFFRDISERKMADLALFEEKERAQATLRSIGDGVIVVDEVGRITFMNPLAETLTGWASADAIERSHDEVLSFITAEGKRLLPRGPPPDSSEASVPLVDKSLLLERRDGQTLAIEGTVTQLRDRGGRRAGSVVAFRDVSEWRKLTAQLSYQATHDSLTGLVNRTELERRLQLLIDGSEPDEVHSLLYLDLDQFKVVNDTSGHIAGDELLKQLAGVLRGHIRSHDTLARLGGDEFGVLLERCAQEHALRIAEKLRQAVGEFVFHWGGHVFSVGVSVGHVSFQGSGATLGGVLSKADEACYLSKDLGRNRVHSYQSGDEELARRHGEMEWVGRLRKALKEDRYVLYEQEIVDLHDRTATPHFEILIRMRSESGELIPPIAFIPAAERYNLMPAIDRWVISSVLAVLGGRIRADPSAERCLYAINLSGSSITDVHLAQFIRDQLGAFEVPGKCVCFEITETAAIGNLTHAVKLMLDLKGLGCRFALDDFGSGMSSFAYLKRLPVDFLKIDGVFIRDIAINEVDHAMVASIHQIGHLMGLRTIAEFVENADTAERLRVIGVDYGQGFALGKPRPFNR